MRRVKGKKYVPVLKKWKDVEGYLLAWSTEAEFEEDGSGYESPVALVETLEGKVEVVFADKIQFINPTAAEDDIL